MFNQVNITGLKTFKGLELQTTHNTSNLIKNIKAPCMQCARVHAHMSTHTHTDTHK